MNRFVCTVRISLMCVLAAIVAAELLSFYLVALTHRMIHCFCYFFHFISSLISHLAAAKVLQTESIDLCGG